MFSSDSAKQRENDHIESVYYIISLLADHDALAKVRVIQFTRFAHHSSNVWLTSDVQQKQAAKLSFMQLVLGIGCIHVNFGSIRISKSNGRKWLEIFLRHSLSVCVLLKEYNK